MAFAWGRNVSYTILLEPRIGCRIIRPHIVEPLCAVRTPETVQELAFSVRLSQEVCLQVQLVIVADDRMVRPRRWYFGFPLTGIFCILNQEFPLICGVLQRIQVESHQVVEEVSLHLATENVYLGAQDIKRMSVTSGRSGSWG